MRNNVLIENPCALPLTPTPLHTLSILTKASYPQSDEFH